MNNSNYKITAIILAAGKGKRFGCPKIRAKIDGQLFAEHIINSLKQARIDDYKIVVSQNDFEFAVENFGEKHIIVNPLPDSEMFASVKIGLQQCLDYDGIIIWPVDHPLVEITTLEKLITAFLKNHNQIIKPVKEGRGGHPIILPKVILSMVFSDKSVGNLKGIITQSNIEVNHVAVKDNGVIENLNTVDSLIVIKNRS